jgi:hypothetical protein
MSLLFRTIEAFPRGRNTEELIVLFESDFDKYRCASILAELENLSGKGFVQKARDGRWLPTPRGQNAKQSDQPIELSPKVITYGAPCVAVKNRMHPNTNKMTYIPYYVKSN